MRRGGVPHEVDGRGVADGLPLAEDEEVQRLAELPEGADAQQRGDDVPAVRVVHRPGGQAEAIW